MASNRTHRPVGRAGAAVTCAALGVPILLWVVPIVAAHRSSPWPDHLERVPRWLWQRTRHRWPDGKVDRVLRKLQVHRRWTHWISVGLAFSLAAAAAVALALFGAAALVLVALEGIRPDRQVTMPPEVLEISAWVSALVALGVFVGYALHSYLDGWTELGSPMGGPWRKERLHVVPRWIRRRRERRGREPWLDEADEEKLRKWSPRVIVLSIAAHFHADLAPVVVQLFDAGRQALA